MAGQVPVVPSQSPRLARSGHRGGMAGAELVPVGPGPRRVLEGEWRLAPLKRGEAGAHVRAPLALGR